MEMERKRIEEVREFRSEVYVSKNRRQEVQVRDREDKESGMMMGQVWGIDKRRYEKD